MASLRILVADKLEVVRCVIVALLAEHPEWEVCGEAADGRQAVEKTAQLSPDIILLDLALLEITGLEAARQIVGSYPEKKIIFLTPSESEEVVREVFAAGAHGLVLKPNATRDLVSAIWALQQGRTFFSPRQADLILKAYFRTAPTGAQVETTPLTDRQREILRLIATDLSHPPSRRRRRTPALFSRKTLAAVLLLIAAAAISWTLFGRQIERSGVIDRIRMNLGGPSPASARTNGNPDTQVWIDLHTALYYCPGDKSYGKTSRGRLARQRDAQLDHFSPASRKPCE